MKLKPSVINIFLIGITLSSLIFSPLILDYTLTPRLISIAIFILLSILGLILKKRADEVKIDLIVLSYFGFVVFSCLTTLWAHTPTEAIFENSKLVMAFAVFLLAYDAFKKDTDYTLTMLSKMAMLLVIVELGIVLFQLSHLKIINKEALYSVYGANSHKNLLSSFLYINLFFLVLGVLRLKNLWKFLSILCILLNIGMIVLLQTKAVWIAVVVSILLFGCLFLYRKFNFTIRVKWALPICLIIANVFFIFIQPQIINRGLSFNKSQIESEKYSSKTELDNERLELWNKTYEMIHKHPFIGVGSGNWQIHFPDATLKGMYRAEDLNFTFQRPHNDLLWIISETGYIGFNLFLLFIFSIILFLIQKIKAIGIDAMLCVRSGRGGSPRSARMTVR